MNPKRWTLVVVCAATAMLMLDIAVVNTALSRIAERPRHRPHRPAVGRRRLHARARRDGAHRRRRSPTASAAAGCSRSASSSSPLASLAVRGGADIDDAQRRPRGAGRRRGDDVRRLARAARQRVPGRRRSAPSALAAYGATIGGAFAVGPLVGGALTSGLDWRWIFLINLPLGIVLPVDHPRATSTSRATRARRASTGPARSRSTAGLFLLVLALLRGNEDGWGSTIDRRRARRRGRPAGRVRRDRGARRGADAPARALPQPVVHRRADRGVRDLGVVLRGVPLHDAVPAAGARAVARSRPASSTCPARS